MNNLRRSRSQVRQEQTYRLKGVFKGKETKVPPSISHPQDASLDNNPYAALVHVKDTEPDEKQQINAGNSE